MQIQFKRRTRLAHAAALALYAATCLVAWPALAAPDDIPADVSKKSVSDRYAQLPMLFERNDGQTADEVRFLARGMGYSLFLTSTEAIFALRPALSQRERDTGGRAPASGPSPSAVLRMSLYGANPAPRLEAQGLQAGASHYFRGADPTRWRTDVAQYAKVFYREVYPGIDLVYYGNQQQLEYDFVVEPERDPQRIAIDFEGVQSLHVNDAGELVLKTPLGEVVQNKPVVYQEIDGERRPVEAQYRVLGDRRIGFEVGPYDRSMALVIDPVLAYNTYLGGSGDEHISSIAVDAAGNTYVTGSTASVDFPTATTITEDGAVEDVFVTKFNAHGNAVLYSTYLGGSGGEHGSAIDVDPSGNVHVSGATTSADFPTSHPIQPRLGGGQDGFVARLDAAGRGLMFSTYLGGTRDDSVQALDVDETGAAYVAGWTDSTDFPVINAVQSSLRGERDAFVAKMDGANGLIYSMYLGGSFWDIADGIAVDSTGAAYVTGSTDSFDFSVVNELQTTKAGGIDAFLTKVSPWGSISFGLSYSTYYGGSGDDYGRDVAVDGSGHVYFGGATIPPATGEPNDFPVHAGVQLSPGGGMDGFLVGMDHRTQWSLPELIFSTYYGGSGGDQIRELAPHEIGVYVVGLTDSVDFPVLWPTQTANGGDIDVLIGDFLFNGEMLWSTFFGGSGADHGYAAAALGHRNLYVGGGTNNRAQPAVGRYNAGRGGAQDGFLVRFGRLTVNRQQDFDGDGVADVLWRNNATGANSIWRSANAATQQAITGVPSRDWQIVGLGRFDDDYRTDVLWRNSRTGANAIWLSANHLTQKPVAAVANHDWEVAGVGDFDRDFDTDDILWRNHRTGANTIWLSADHATPKTVATVANRDWRIVGIDDFNDDDSSDILWRNRATGANAIWLSGNNATQQPIAAVSSQDWQVAGVGDFLADNKADILWHNQRTGTNVIWRDGNAASVETLPATSSSWIVAAIGDYNGDGRADVVWRNSADGRHSIWDSGTPTLPQAMVPVANQSWQIIK